MDKNSLALLRKCFIPFNSPVVYLIFEKNESSGTRQDNSQQYHCNVCNTHISGVANIRLHSEGQQHIKTLEKLTNSLALDLTMDVGEENVILGFEYILELVESNKDKTIYCGICDRSFTSSMHSIFVEHLKSLDHNEKYLRKHFAEIYEHVHYHLESHPKVKNEFLQLICSLIKSNYPDEYEFMRPTVTKLELYSRGETIFHNQHLEQDEEFRLMIMENLQIILRGLKALSMKQEAPPSSPGNDVEIIEPKIPLVNLCEDIESEEEEGFFNSHVTSQNLFNDEVNKKIRELRNFLDKVPAFTPIIKPLSDGEVEELMTKYENLPSQQQQNLVEILHLIKKADPERFQKLNSPF